MNIEELRKVIEKLRKYEVYIEDSFAFISSLNKRQINNILDFNPEEKDFMNENEWYTYLINYADVLGNLNLLNYDKFNEVVDVLFSKLNEMLYKHKDTFNSYAHGIRKIMECKSAIENDTAYNDVNRITEKNTLLYNEKKWNISIIP